MKSCSDLISHKSHEHERCENSPRAREIAFKCKPARTSLHAESGGTLRGDWSASFSPPLRRPYQNTARRPSSPAVLGANHKVAYSSLIFSKADGKYCRDTCYPISVRCLRHSGSIFGKKDIFEGFKKFKHNYVKPYDKFVLPRSNA